MKTIVCTTYVPPEVLQFKEVEKPALKDNEILIRAYATLINFGDNSARYFNFKPDNKPHS